MKAKLRKPRGVRNPHAYAIRCGEVLKATSVPPGRGKGSYKRRGRRLAPLDIGGRRRLVCHCC